MVKGVVISPLINLALYPLYVILLDCWYVHRPGWTHDVVQKEYTGTLLKPCRKCRVSSEYGPRWGRMHRGVDFAMPQGSPVLCAKSGKVKWVGTKSGYGRTIEVDHGDCVTLYGHLSAYRVSEGQTVDIGETIALSGNTGRSTGPHLHFGLRVGPKWVDPIQNF